MIELTAITDITEVINNYRELRVTTDRYSIRALLPSQFSLLIPKTASSIVSDNNNNNILGRYNFV